MPRKKVWIVVLGIFILLIFWVIYFIFGPKPLPKLPSAEEVNSQTSNWVEYVNEAYGFKVKRPPNSVEADWFGYDGVAIEANDDEEDYFVCSIYAWSLGKNNLFSDDDIHWSETVFINGLEAERRHVIRSTIYDFEYIVITGRNFIYELEADPNSKGFGYRKTCELIFSTFELNN